MDDWKELYQAARAVQRERQLSPWVQAGGVAAAIGTPSGIYVGVCLDTACSLGMCAERAAAANLITQGENRAERLVVVMPGGVLGTPCGACRELFFQLGWGDLEILLDLGEPRTVRLRELLPLWWNGQEQT